jgi:prepilin-type N-terminal cleavage/methylation domain-containing protein
MKSTRRSIRAGFTLVELMVAMALTLFVMTILVEAFGAGMDTFQTMRGLGDIQDNLRSSLNMLKAELAMDHFEGGRKLSDLNFYDEPRREGYFFVGHGSPMTLGAPGWYVYEGTDLDGADKSFLACDHRLSFTVRARGNRRENFFFESTGGPLLGTRLSATNLDLESVYGYDPVGGNPQIRSVTSQWGEIMYHMKASGAVIPGTTPPAPGAPAYGPIRLFNLYRSAFLILPYADDLNKAPNAATDPVKYPRLAHDTPPRRFLTPNDMAKDPTKFPNNRSNPLNAAAEALVCTNVVSFQVRVMKSVPRRPAPPRASDTLDANGTIAGYDDLVDAKGNLEHFDSSVRPPTGYRLLGIQIIMRVYDPATGLTRQATLTQDL